MPGKFRLADSQDLSYASLVLSNNFQGRDEKYKVQEPGSERHVLCSTSIVIPIRNRWSELVECLNALSQQKDSPLFEVIVIDDGSQVPIPDRLKALIASCLFPVRYQRQVALGIGAARNHGAALATGDLILFVDSDSILGGDCLNRLAVCAATHPEDLAFQLHLLAKPDTWVGRMDCFSLAALQKAAQSNDGHIAYADTAGFAVRSSYARKVGELFNVGVVRGSDTLVMAVLCEYGHPPRFVPDAIVYHCHKTPLLGYLCKYFSIGYRGGKADKIAKQSLKLSSWPSEQRRSIFRELCMNVAKHSRGYRTLGLVLIAHCLKIAGRAAYEIFGVKSGRCDVLHSPVDGVTSTEVVARVVQAAERRAGITATYLNGWTLVQVERDAEFSRLLGTFDLCFADGIGVVHSMWLTRFRRITKVTANDFFGLLFQEAANRGLKLAFIGAEEGVTQTVALQMQQSFPGLEITFCSTGYLNREQESNVLDQLKGFDPHIVLVGRGQPLQERWVQQCRSFLPKTSFLCVGGLFDYISGRVEPTPTWIRRIGFEWLHRVLNHPHYWYMYALGIPLLFWYILKFQFTRVVQAVLD